MKSLACALASFTLHAAVAVIAASFLLPNRLNSTGGGSGSGQGRESQGSGTRIELAPTRTLIGEFEHERYSATDRDFAKPDPISLDLPEHNSLAYGVGGSEPAETPSEVQGSPEYSLYQRRNCGSSSSDISGGSPSRGNGSGEGSGGGIGNCTETDPVEVDCFQPSYPKDARSRKIQGSVLVSFEIQTDGSVGKAHVAQSSGHAELDDAAVEAVGKWRYKPATRNGAPIARSLRARFTFKLQ